MTSQIKSTKELIGLYFTLLSSWTVYATCQGDTILPVIGFLLISVSLLKKMLKSENKKKENLKKISWATILSLSLLLSWAWITLYPRNYPSDFIQSYAIFILQTGSIFLSIFLWFNSFYIYQAFFLRLLAWLTVALSVNISFSPVSLAAFCCFCLLNIGFIVLQQNHHKKETHPKPDRFPAFKHFFIICTFSLITICLFSFFVTVFKVGDAVYTRFIRDYTIMPSRHPFFSFNPVLDIKGPGYSGGDVRPVLEIEKENSQPIYLITQIFDQYQDGRWLVADTGLRNPITDQIDPPKNSLKLKMLIQLKDVIPAPQGTDAVAGYNGPYEHDSNGIIYSVHKDIHQVELTTNSLVNFQENKPIDWVQLTRLDQTFKSRLKPFLDKISDNSADPWVISQKLQNHFQSNYNYSLNVNFRADDDGIIYLLDHQPAAYCSFFASTMSVLLRSADIPSRLVVGFLATETTGRKNDRFLVRVRDAHAWVEAYLPVEGKPERRQWVRFDPTPHDARLFTLNNGRPINIIADYIWLSMVRLRSDFENLESEKLLFRLVMILILLIGIRNFSTIASFIRSLKNPGQIKYKLKKKNTLSEHLHTYREFERFIKQRFKTQQRFNETLTELILRLYKNFPDKKEYIKKIEQFIKRYQDSRFGKNEEPFLRHQMAELKKSCL